MPTKSLMHPSIIQSTRTGALSPVLLSKPRLQVLQPEWRRITKRRSHVYSLLPPSVGLEPCVHDISYSSPHLPPYTSESPPSPPPSSGPVIEPGGISDEEWNLRAGRAVYTLRTTLPDFFETGLVSHVDQDRYPSASPSRQVTPGTDTYNERPRAGLAPESIYAPNIRLSYMPPTALSLPSAFPRTLQVEGLPLYHASATFIKHTLSAFNTELHVDLRKLHVHSTGARRRQIVIRTIVTGKSRISGSHNEWDVHSTYTLSPHSALIDLHVVESIHPAPHITFYDGLRAALTRMAGLDVDRQASSGMRGCVSDRHVGRTPIREQ